MWFWQLNVVSVIKKDKKASASELVKAINRFVPLLRNQQEEEAADLLDETAQKLAKQEIGSAGFSQSIITVINSFEGDFELKEYTLRESNCRDWTDADELSVVSNRIYALARRLK